jgi:hypothetical protein
MKQSIINTNIIALIYFKYNFCSCRNYKSLILFIYIYIYIMSSNIDILKKLELSETEKKTETEAETKMVAISDILSAFTTTATPPTAVAPIAVAPTAAAPSEAAPTAALTEEEAISDFLSAFTTIEPLTKDFYKTNIINATIKVFSLSDIHGDIQSFIIALRDLAEVIRKKKAPIPINPIPIFNQSIEKSKDEKIFNLMHYTDFSNNKYDDNMEYILNLDLNTDEDIYKADLNYEWCGGNTHVVICGDIIDPFRNKYNCLKENDLPCSYYPQIELKILMFINALNKQAKHSCGKIVKLFGNHELGAIISPFSYAHNIHKIDIDLDNNYYKNKNRRNIFTVGNYGFKLLVEDGCGILIKINNTIFVHGDLKETYDTYNDLNQFINDPSKQTEQTQQEWNAKFYMHFKDNSSLLSPLRGDDIASSNRAKSRSGGDNKESNEFCADLIKSFIKFAGDRTIITENEDNLKLVIGHCTQHSISTVDGDNGFNVTYDTKIKQNSVKEVFGNNIYTGKVNFDRTDYRTKIFGITMECQIPDTSLNRLYRVDVGSSRGFDDVSNKKGTWAPLTLEAENRFLYSKTPQILEINIDGTINIIKSKMRNTRIHLPRPNYEKHALKIPQLQLYTKDHNYYEQKYLKYKNKYLQLKQLN